MPEAQSRTGAYLTALTPESADALRARAINLPYLPFRVGRESRKILRTERGLKGERRRAAAPNNDLYLVETGELMNVSREHLLIDRDAGGFFVLDRGSTCGTLVEGTLVGGGGGRPLRAPLSDHDVVIVGTSSSPYVFKFRLDT